MSDFDFEELDKAVAGATDNGTATAGAHANDFHAPANPVQRPVSSVGTPAQSSTSDLDAVAGFAPAARRSAGRFMDVVHPSSDMRTRTAPASIDTLGSIAEASQNSFTPPVTPNPVAAPEDATPDWAKPLESPFLTDAKVEKRPLGGVGPLPAQVLLDAPEDELLLEATALPDPIDFAEQVVEPEAVAEPVVAPVVVEEQSIKQLDELETSVQEVAPVIPVAAAPAPVEEVPAGSTSITQQYTEKAGTEQQSGAIYDTENYHKPLAAVAKKHSGFWTILWILLVVILGAGAGVAFYLFVLPLL